MVILGDTSTVSDDDSDWIPSDYSHDDEDEDEDGPHWQRQPELGVGVVDLSRRNGEFPPRVRWLRRKHLLHLLMTRRRMEAMKCAAHGGGWHDDDHDGSGKVATMPAVQLARPQIQDSPPRRCGKRKWNDTDTDTDTDTAPVVRSESYNRNSNDNDNLGESTGKRQRLGSCHVGGLDGLPVNIDGPCEVAAPPITITGHLFEASALSVGRRRSQRIREKLGSACVTTRMS